MLFNSFHFIVFFPLVILLYYLVPQKWRWALLLCASYYFYVQWKMSYILLILLSTIVDYAIAILIEGTSSVRNRKLYLAISLFSNLGILFVFKYFNFFNNTLRHLFLSFHIDFSLPDIDVLLPVGISFYTFQTLSYTIDVYNGNISAERHFGRFALYVSFFPQLVAGPIERAKRLLPQLKRKVVFNYSNTVEGLQLMCWGFFKKVFIADRLSLFVSKVYATPDEFHGFPVVMATYFFAFQIYCDFSGYSDIAIGAARVLGIDLMTNFKTPYFSKNIREFWQRWHISLSTWFRDYLYIPLGGNKTKSVYGWYKNIVVVFLVSGLWHGANWTYVFWGLLHGIYFLVSIYFAKTVGSNVFKSSERVNVIATFLSVCLTFNLVCFSWIFFRANSLEHSFDLIRNISFSNIYLVLNVFSSKFEFLLSIAGIFFLLLVEFFQKERSINSMINAKPLLVRWSVYFVLVFAILLFGVFNNNEFIYFQF